MKALLLITCLVISQQASAQTTKPKAAAPAAASTSGTDSLIENFRCERSNEGLADMKMKMIENCNLDKPFSSSHSSAVKDTYMYCCHKKAQ